MTTRKLAIGVVALFVMGVWAVTESVSKAHAEIPYQAGCSFEEAMTIEALIFQIVLAKRELEAELDKGDYTLENQTSMINDLQGLELRLNELVNWGKDCLKRYEAAKEE